MKRSGTTRTWWLALAAVAAVAGFLSLWGLFPGHPEGASRSMGTAWDARLPGEDGETAPMEGGGEVQHKARGRNGVRSGSASESDEEAPQFPMVDAILADATLDPREAALRLLEIVKRADAPLQEREEALAHGLNLDFSRFSGLVEDPNLPQPLALQVFDAMLNENEARDTQVRVCLALLEHADESLRGEAAGQLGFYIGFEEWTDRPELLKQEARAFLEEWAKRPPREPDPVDPDAEVPETLPILPADPAQGGEARSAKADSESGQASIPPAR